MSETMTKGEVLSARWRAKLILVLVGVPGIGLATVSGVFNSMFALQLGHAEGERAAWLAFAVCVTLLISGLPIAIDLLRRSGDATLARIAAGVLAACFAYSLMSAMGFSSGTRSRNAAEADAAISSREAIQATIQRTENEISALPAHRPAATVASDARRAEASAGRAFTTSGDCQSPTNRWQREACRPVLDLRAELAAAEDAQRLEDKLAGQREQLAGVAVFGEADAQAGALAWLSGGLFGEDTWRRLMSLFVAALVEFGAATCMLICARSVSVLLAGQDRGCEAAPAVAAPVEVLEPSPLAAVEPELGWQMWFQACVTAQRGGRITPKDAFAHYEAWAGLNNVAAVLPYVTFGRRMSEAVGALGGKVGKSNGRFYADVSLTKLGMNGVPMVDDKAGE